ncbi:MAG TPA: hypothetical protein VE998_07895 [Terriglobales bacterium]|nr:hypothetical protein [Terriglobales bacterium]
MTYLDPSEYQNYGLDPLTSDAWIAAASAIIESYCRRPSLGVQQYTERLRVTPDRNSVQLSYLPLAIVAPATLPFVSGRARYAMARRGEAPEAYFIPGASPGVPAPLAYDVALAFALPGSWTTLDVTTLDYFSDTGEVTFPYSILGLAYNEVEITYNAGLAAIPAAVKFACAQIVQNAQATPALNVRSAALQGMRLDYFADSLIDSNVQRLLEPYVSRRIA